MTQNAFVKELKKEKKMLAVSLVPVVGKTVASDPCLRTALQSWEMLMERIMSIEGINILR